MADAPIQLLEQVPLFQGLPHNDLERVARSFKERHFSAGDTVAAEGSGGVGFFVIGEGTASVDVHGEKRAQLGPGDYFGEIALIDDQARRTATIRDAMTHTQSAAELVARCRTGDQNAWAELVERFSRYVFAIATQGFRLREQDAEDVFQEVFTKVYERLDSLRSDEAIQPWIAQLTRRVCVDRLRAGSREEATDEPEPAID